MDSETRFVIFAVIVSALFLLFLPAAFAQDTMAKQVYLIDDTTDTVLMVKDADTMMYPSSMSKLMTLYVLFEHLKSGNISLDSRFPVSEKAWRKGGSKMFVEVGKQVKVEDLIRGIIIQSGNDACIVVAEGIAGSEEAFAQLMTETARKIGLTQSNFANASGWPDERHYMTAQDLGALAKRLIHDFSEYYHYFSGLEFTYGGIRQPNRNRLLDKGIGVDGLKTGHTEIAGYGITLSARDEKSGRRLILVVNGLDSEDAREKESEALLRHGFSDFQVVTVANVGDVLDMAPVWFGTTEEVGVMLSDPLQTTIPLGAEKEMRASLEYHSPLSPPIFRGDEVGVLRLYRQDDLLREVPLVATADVEASGFFKRITQVIAYYVGG